MKLILRTYKLDLMHTFTISRQSFDSKLVLIVELKDGNFSGYGEASENPYYGITIDQIMSDLSNIKDQIELEDQNAPEIFWNKMHPLLKENMFALCALDIAYNDLYAKRKGKKLYDLWGLKNKQNVLSNFTIGIDSIEKMVTKIKETPWPIYKIKLGTKNDLSIIKELRKHTNAIFRVDANGAWGVDETINNAIALKKLGVEFLEQPLSADNLEGNKTVFKHSVLPVIADESCQIESDVENCFQMFHGVNVKLVKSGGLTPARRMIKKAKELGMKSMVGCMTESSIGISAIAHLLPEINYVDMDGAMLLKNDIASGVSLDKGVILYAQENGTGARLIDKNPIRIIK